MHTNLSPLVGKDQGSPTSVGLFFIIMKKKKVIVYVDGFNFYYGLKSFKSRRNWKKYYWLDIVKLFEQFMKKDQELVRVKYFSAKSTDVQKNKRQDALFQANKENPKFQLILGKYLSKNKTCNQCGYIIRSFEEKESDVRLATQILHDIYKKECDVSIVVSADSDMVPVVEICKELNHPTYVYFPPNQFSSNLQNMCNAIKLDRYESRFQKSLLEDVVILNSTKYELHIPEKWEAYKQ